MSRRYPNIDERFLTGFQLREIRKKFGITQRELVEKEVGGIRIGYKVSSISRIETRNANITGPLNYKLQHFFAPYFAREEEERRIALEESRIAAKAEEERLAEEEHLNQLRGYRIGDLISSYNIGEKDRIILNELVLSVLWPKSDIGDPIYSQFLMALFSSASNFCDFRRKPVDERIKEGNLELEKLSDVIRRFCNYPKGIN